MLHSIMYVKVCVIVICHMYACIKFYAQYIQYIFLIKCITKMLAPEQGADLTILNRTNARFR